ncbi:hypothetical protein ACJIZ3_021583 [Penstemon smallii]|uniref:F-box domain-containing protein n=1 Tax=Penstemon smallii TaxID=265156 RepID=A0ABD3SLY4_9LAMI
MAMVNPNTNDEKMKPSKHIPFDLISENILPRFPVKSLIRFTSVCKEWETLIKSPEFIATHFKRNNRPESEGQYPLILSNKLSYTVKNQIAIYFDKLGSMSGCSLNDDYPAEHCNGLILIKVLKENYGGSEIEFLLWNPSIKKSIIIESFYPRVYMHNRRRSESGYDVRGLGFHESSNDYRVVKIKYTHVKKKVSSRVKIYSLRTNMWRNVDSNPDGLMGFRGGVFLNGSVHWLATRMYSYGAYIGCAPNEYEIESILSFDFEKECFGEMKLPKDFAERSASPAGLVAFKEFQGSLAAVFIDYDVDKCFVWVMGEYGVTDSWNKKMTIRFPKNCSSPLGFTKNGMLVCEDKKVSGFIFLDSEKFEEYVNCDDDNMEIEDSNDDNSEDESFGEESHVMVIDYMESLALLE